MLMPLEWGFINHYSVSKVAYNIICFGEDEFF